MRNDTAVLQICGAQPTPLSVAGHGGGAAAPPRSAHGHRGRWETLGRSLRAPPGGGAAARAGLGGSAAAAGGTGGAERAAGGRAGTDGRREGKEGRRRWLACLLLGPPVLRRCPGGRAAAEANGEAALSGLPSAGVGSRGQRRGGRAMPLTSLLALPFLLLLPALKLLFSPTALMAGNFPEGRAQAGLVLRRAPQGSGHTVR